MTRSLVYGLGVYGLAAVVAMFLGRPALAEDPPQGLDFGNPADLFKQLDKNGDGQITADEMPQEHKRLFERLVRMGDKNGDGKLSLEEFTAALKDVPPAPGGQPLGVPGSGPGGPGGIRIDPAELFKRLDKNNDGKITADEIPEERRENFKQMLERLGKKPEDGVGHEEFARFAGAMMGVMGQRPNGVPGPGNPQPGNSQPGMRPNGPSADVLFRLLDKNHDGVISEDEISAAPEALAKFAKQNGGKITAEMAGLPPGQGPMPETAPNGRRPPNAANPAGAGNAAGNQGRFLLNRFKEMDKNGDGKVSKDEAEGMLKERFDEIDTNHDGFIDETELQQMIEKISERYRQAGQNPGQPLPGRANRRPGEEKPAPEKPAEKPAEVKPESK